MERRTSRRTPLDVPFFVQLELSDGTLVPGMLIDVSCGGLQVGVTPQQADTSEFLGQKVIVLGLPDFFAKGARGCKGLVAWVSPQRCGVRLYEALQVDEESLLSFAHGV